MSLSFTEENYLKTIFQLIENDNLKITTNAIAEKMSIAPATVTDMLRKLSEKKLINYRPYYGVSLTISGRKQAVGILRKHRLWELFLVEKLRFSWDEVHDIAEQLEHIQSETLVRRLYSFLGNPVSDPHGDPIPDESGNFPALKSIPLSEAKSNEKVVIAGVNDHRPDFLQYLKKVGLLPGKKIIVKEVTEYDRSMDINLSGIRKSIHISHDVAKNILVTTP